MVELIRALGIGLIFAAIILVAAAIQIWCKHEAEKRPSRLPPQVPLDTLYLSNGEVVHINVFRKDTNDPHASREWETHSDRIDESIRAKLLH